MRGLRLKYKTQNTKLTKKHFEENLYKKGCCVKIGVSSELFSFMLNGNQQITLLKSFYFLSNK